MKKKCSRLPDADADANAKYECSNSHDYKSNCTKGCQPGYELTKNVSVRCDEDQKWASTDRNSSKTENENIFEGKCVKVKCPELKESANHTWRCTGQNEYQSTCTIRCPEGLRSVKPILTECLANGSWSSYKVECAAVIVKLNGNYGKLVIGFGLALLFLIVVLITIIYLKNKRHIDSTIFQYRSPVNMGDRIEIVDHDELAVDSEHKSYQMQSERQGNLVEI